VALRTLHLYLPLVRHAFKALRKMRALLLDAEGKTAVVREVPQPTPNSEEILVRVYAVALNPVDPLYVANPLGQTGRTVGSDFAGTVAALGDGVSSHSRLSIGDRVAGFLQGACSVNERPGAFAEYLVVPWDLVWRVPEDISLEEAATISLCGLTAAQSLNFRLDLPTPFPWSTEQALPKSETINVFIYGASSSVGLFAAQVARHSASSHGFTIRLIGTASSARFPLLQGAPYNYDHLLDYHDSSWPEKVREITGGQGIQYAFDCISEHDSVTQVHSTLGPGGKQAIVRSRQAGAWSAGSLDPDPIYGAVWEGLGVEIQYAFFSVPASPSAREFAAAFYKWQSETGALRPNPVRLMPGSLEKMVQDGFVLLGRETMKERGGGRNEEWMRPVSAEKLVYLLENQ
jgi:NADPH:quinone reductase-like Zn-dependent oxidoreductase